MPRARPSFSWFLWSAHKVLLTMLGTKKTCRHTGDEEMHIHKARHPGWQTTSRACRFARWLETGGVCVAGGGGAGGVGLVMKAMMRMRKEGKDRLALVRWSWLFPTGMSTPWRQEPCLSTHHYTPMARTVPGTQYMLKNVYWVDERLDK